jgi:hypothetical protein
MKDMLWIENIVESKSTSPFFTNFRFNTTGFVNVHKVVARSSFSAFPSAQNDGENRKLKRP